MWLLYNALLTLLAPLWAPWMVWRAWRRKEKPNWRERQGDYRESVPKKGDRPRLWLHAVSVGEVVAARPLLGALRKALPHHEIVLSVTTSSGHQTAREGPEGLYDHLVYAPIDVARFALSAMQRVRPDALVVMETELWMNLFWAAKTFDAKVFVANGRLSDRAFPRARRLGAFYRALFGMVDLVLAQSESDAERFRELGATRVETAGNVKFDGALEGVEDGIDWRKELGLDERPVIVVGSARREEFSFVANSLAWLAERAQIVIAPRHVEVSTELQQAFDDAAEETDFPLAYRSRSERLPPRGALVLDTYGELARVYRVADLAIVGGGFKKLGGQNIIQPLAQGKPVLHGSHMANFRDVAALAERTGASIACPTGADLAREVEALLKDPARRAQMGEAARALVEANRGASERMAKAIASTLKG